MLLSNSLFLSHINLTRSSKTANHFNCFAVEEISEERILQNLIQGTATGEKWQKLQEIAEDYGVAVEL